MPGPDAARYYEQLEDKHFSAGRGVGSVFADSRVSSLEDLLALAISQRGDLMGDDHALLGDPGRPGTYYVAVEVDGLSGATTGADLSPSEFVMARRSKDGVPPDYLVFGRERERVSVATLVMADEQVDGKLTGRRILITAHPGLPSARASKDREVHQDNTLLTPDLVGADETVLLADVEHLPAATRAVAQALVEPGVVGPENAVLSTLARIARGGHSNSAAAQELLQRAATVDTEYDRQRRESVEAVDLQAADTRWSAQVAVLVAAAHNCQVPPTPRVTIRPPTPPDVEQPRRDVTV